MRLAGFTYMVFIAVLAVSGLMAGCDMWGGSDSGLMADGDFSERDNQDSADAEDGDMEKDLDLDSVEDNIADADTGDSEDEDEDIDTLDGDSIENDIPDIDDSESDEIDSDYGECCYTDKDSTDHDIIDRDNADIDTADGDNYDNDIVDADTLEVENTEIDSADFLDINQTWPVPPTGQNKCYNDASEIPCPALGQPFYGQDAQYADLPRAFNEYEISGNSVAEDSLTGLMWAKTEETPTIWLDAMNYCLELSYADFTDWRLPNAHELRSLVSYGLYNPASDFPGMLSNWFWSSTSSAVDQGFSWGAHMGAGYLRYDDINHLHNSARCVRLGSDGRTAPFKSASTERFVISEPAPGETIVTDTVTAMIFALSYAEDLNWQEALAYCEDSDYAGFSDWRLPDIHELASLVNYGRYNPASDLPDMPVEFFWSSSSYVDNPTYAWYVYFYDGRLRAEVKYYEDGAAQCVRGGP